jgi:hypothetical protein
MVCALKPVNVPWFAFAYASALSISSKDICLTVPSFSVMVALTMMLPPVVFEVVAGHEVRDIWRCPCGVDRRLPEHIGYDRHSCCLAVFNRQTANRTGQGGSRIQNAHGAENVVVLHAHGEKKMPGR